MNTMFVSEARVRREMEEALDSDNPHPEWSSEAHQLRKEMLDQGQSLGLSREQKREVATRWADLQIQRAKDEGRLLSPQQAQDHEAGRVFQVGDRAKYIGPTRAEALNGEDEIVTREQGQLGKITRIHKDSLAGRIITFRPTPPPDAERVVELQVREGTLGFLTLERVPGED